MLSMQIKVSGSEVLEPETVRVKTLLARLQSTLENPVEIVTDCPDVAVSVDLKAWLRMCRNLLDNARDAAGPALNSRTFQEAAHQFAYVSGNRTLPRPEANTAVFLSSATKLPEDEKSERTSSLSTGLAGLRSSLQPP